MVLCRTFHTAPEQEWGWHLLSPIVLVPVPVPDKVSVITPLTLSRATNCPIKSEYIDFAFRLSNLGLSHTDRLQYRFPIAMTWVVLYTHNVNLWGRSDSVGICHCE